MSPDILRGATLSVDLGGASGYAVLAGSGITVAGAVGTTSITRDIGTFPTSVITGLENVNLDGYQPCGRRSHRRCQGRLGRRGRGRRRKGL